MAQVGVVAVGTWLVIPSVSPHTDISVLRYPGSQLLPLGDCIRETLRHRVVGPKFAFADKETTDQITKLMTNRATLVKHAEWRKTHRGRWLIPLIGIRG